uniref:Uncharacterized protein n=1 Tax=Bombyx mori TaxID=7091 RepID=A0A8R2QS99_BOMMO|nr:uncharacterized protein LOC110386633 isoform X2 [Bombyx mori]
MNYSVNNINSHIFGRSEGKIKSYKSCTDLRAWSHDEKARDRYLRDWMRSDMPVYIISVRTLVTLLKIMTCKTSGRLAPRCQPNCKSKIVLDTICTSSHIMKECLKNNQSVQDFLVKNFKQVSVLKVLHKTNVTTLSDSDENRSSKENPLRFLTKVHNTFGEIFKREMSLVNDKNTLVKSDFQNGFQNVTSSKSAPSCSSVSSLESNYVSMKDLNVIVQQ